MKILPIILLLSLILEPKCLTQTGKKQNSFVLMSYNTENLFDTIDDPHTSDNDFTPGSKKHWNTDRYELKVQSIARVIHELVPGGFPDIVLLCEVESRSVLEDLLNVQELKKASYRIIFRKSHDSRGISIGLLYRSSSFKPLAEKLIDLEYPGERKESTRGILYVKGLIFNADTLHIFGNHWKSRVGSQAETESKRIFDAGVLKSKTDSLLKLNKNTNIICLGDFNDEPSSNSISKILEAGCEQANKKNSQLWDAMCPQFMEGKGTYNYKGKWLMLDNIILSQSLLSKKSRLHSYKGEGKVYGPEWLLKYSEKTGLSVPWKTYAGNKYLGGFSDHLPVYIELIRN